jgi:UDP-N-acetylmuramate dehydrogenase
MQVAAAALGITVTPDEPLARHTTFRIGGPADLYAATTTIDQLEKLAELAAEHGIPATILGGGSNVLVSDAGVRGLVIANQTRSCEWRIPELVADSGVALAGLARSGIKAGWSGLEWAVSVPGTVGGAVVGNAGAHGGDIAGNLAWALVAYPGKVRQVLTGEQAAFSYRSSGLKRQLATGESHPVVLAAAFALTRGDVAEMTARADGFLARRRSSQPVEPSAGSIFRNPPGDHAGRLVEAAGLKGRRIGGAQIPERHANFIVNAGGATASDVVALMNLIRQRVYESSGIELVPEILFLGEWHESLCAL